MNANVHNSYALSVGLHAAAIAAGLCALPRELVLESVRVDAQSFTLMPTGPNAPAMDGGSLPTVSVPAIAKSQIRHSQSVPHDQTPNGILDGKRMTIDEYRRAHGVSSQGEAKPVMQLAPPRVRVDSPSLASSSVPMEGPLVGDAAMAQIVSALRAGFRGQDAASTGLSALVEFVAYEDGRLDNGRVVESSGSRDFDAEVLAAISRTRVPTDVVRTPRRFRVLFRVNE